MQVEERFGFPIVNADNIYEVLRERGIRPWELVGEPIDLYEYLYLSKKLTEDEQKDLRFAPKSEVLLYKKPDGELWRGFRSVGKNWATTFMLFPDDLTLIIGEWKHGADTISLVPPTGVPRKLESMSDAARREVEEETGFKPTSLTPLAGPEGIPMSARQASQRYHPFLSVFDGLVERGPSSLDKNEQLQPVMIPVEEWLKLIEAGNVYEDCAISVTYLALRKLGRLQVVS